MAFIAAKTVFFISIATVIGPTPPGTGVIQLALFLACSKSTSPTNREPDNFDASDDGNKKKKKINFLHAKLISE